MSNKCRKKKNQKKKVSNNNDFTFIFNKKLFDMFHLLKLMEIDQRRSKVQFQKNQDYINE